MIWLISIVALSCQHNTKNQMLLLWNCGSYKVDECRDSHEVDWWSTWHYTVWFISIVALWCQHKTQLQMLLLWCRPKHYFILRSCDLVHYTHKKTMTATTTTWICKQPHCKTYMVPAKKQTKNALVLNLCESPQN